ncbi:MAG: hypothetical protein C6W55_10485 [Thermobacillus sp.]|jgi:hypothetical protein|nr:MAG: hypothetical protein C6W55_10485 [Thermobacillus sp.]
MIEHIRRIQFYTRKAATYATDRRPQHMRNRYRFERLMQYKAELNRRIKASGYRWKPAIPLNEEGEQVGQTSTGA